jgi:site-specific DNA-cytosine methylase
MNVLSLFNGVSFGMMALEKSGVKVEKYYSSEIDPYANKASSLLYPDIIQLGDVTKWVGWCIDFSDIDLLLAGFPCQAWSVGGKQQGDNDPRGALVHDLLAIWRHIDNKRLVEGKPPVKFLFENVKMKRDFLEYINTMFKVEPHLINSADVSAQNRQRYYWTNIEVNRPLEVKDIKLSDILEEGWYATRDKSYCLDANYYKGTNFRRYFFCGSRQLALKEGYTPPENMTKDNANDIMRDAKGLWRKLTPKECMLLQTVPPHCMETLLESDISDSQLYKMMGNGWTTDVIYHFLRNLKPIGDN